MKDQEIENKRIKAQKYANETDRFRVMAISLKMNSTHGTRMVSFDNGQWNCTCDFFARKGTCSHIMAAREILINKANLNLES